MSARELRLQDFRTMLPTVGVQPFVAVLFGTAAGLLLVLLAARTSPTVAAAALCGIVVAALVMLYPTLGLLLTAAVIPIERLGRFTNDSSMYTVSLMRIVGVLALGSFLFHVVVRKWKLRVGTAFLIYGAYCAIGFLTVFHTTDRASGVRAAGALLGNLMFFFLVTNTARDWRLARLCVVVWLVFSVAAGLYTIYEWHLGDNDKVNELNVGAGGDRFNTVMQDSSEYDSLGSVERAVGTTSHSAVYGINLILTLPFFAFFLRTARKWETKLIVLAAWGVIFYNILLTNTRATIIIAALVVLLCVVRRLLVIRPAQVFLGLAMSGVLLFFVPDAVFRRVLDVSNYSLQRSGTLRARLEYYSAGLQIARENWLLGIGIGNQITVPKYLTTLSTPATSVHNEYLNTFMEVGLVGWLLFFGFVGYLLWCSLKTGGILRRFGEDRTRTRAERLLWAERYWFVAACQTAMIAVLIYGVQVDVFHFPLKGWWLVASLTSVMYLLARKEVVKQNAARSLIDERRTGDADGRIS